MEYNLIATTTFGLEGITAKELKALGYEDLKTENGKVTFEVKTFAGSWEQAKDIVENWKKNAVKLYPKMLKMLTK